MSAIPRQKKLHPVDCRDSDMGRVGHSLLRQAERGFQSLSKINDLFSEVEEGQLFNRCQAIACSLSVTAAASSSTNWEI